MRRDHGLVDADFDLFARLPPEKNVKTIVAAKNAADVAIADRIQQTLGPAMEIFHVDSKEHGASSIFPDRAELISLVESLLAP